MVERGGYSVWFKTPIGAGAGLVEFGQDGALSEGDSTFLYVGRWSQEGDRLKVNLTAKRVGAGPPGMFGMDEIDLTLVGQSREDGSVSCSGFAKQTPGIRLEVTLYRAS